MSRHAGQRLYRSFLFRRSQMQIPTRRIIQQRVAQLGYIPGQPRALRLEPAIAAIRLPAIGLHVVGQRHPDHPPNPAHPEEPRIAPRRLDAPRRPQIHQHLRSPAHTIVQHHNLTSAGRFLVPAR